MVKNAFLRDKTISLKAKGLLALLLSHSGEWELNHKSEIKNHVKEGKDGYRSALHELKVQGYVVHTTSHDARGVIQHHYDYSDERLLEPCSDNPNSVNPYIKKNKDKKNKNTNSSRKRKTDRARPGEGKVFKKSVVRLADGSFVIHYDYKTNHQSVC